jgi:hypothetical protein
MAVDEMTDLTEPFFTIAPEMFRRVIQKQINNTVAREINNIIASRKPSEGIPDARMSTSIPSTVVQMSNAHGFHYFIVGASIVGKLDVAAP